MPSSSKEGRPNWISAAKLTSNQARLGAQLEVVEQAIDAMSGYAAGARFLLDAARQSRLQSGGAFGAVLELPAELEAAIGAALGEAVDGVLLTGDQFDRALELLEAPEAGRAVLLPVDRVRANVLSPRGDADLLGVASELVKAPPELRGAVELLLGHTLVVKTRAAAQRLVPTIPVHARIVTLRGEVFRGDGLVTAGAVATSAILSQPRQKRELTAALADVGDASGGSRPENRGLQQRVGDRQKRCVGCGGSAGGRARRSDRAAGPR